MILILFWSAMGGLVVTAFAATAALVLREAAWHELEEYCQRRRNPELFSRIFDLREQMGLGATTLQLIAIAFSIPALLAALLDDTSIAQLPTNRWISILVINCFALLIAGSWIPWAITRIGASMFIYQTWRFWWIVSLVSWPLLVAGEFIASLFRRASGIEQDEEDEEEAMEDEILSIVSEAERDGYLEAPARDMIEGIMELDDIDVARVMTPRSQVDMLETTTDWDEMVRFIVDSGRTRIPVYRDEVDNIIGILYAKDVLRESMRSESKRRPIKRLIRDPLVVPATKLLDEMLNQFLGRHVHMAIVQDEYGGMAGVVTIEDVLEEIVGEIVDETDEDRSDDIQRLNPLQADVRGIVPIALINEELGLNLPEDGDFDTVSGLIMNEVKEIPREGRSVMVNGVDFKIQKANRHSIQSVRVTLPEIEEPPLPPS